MKKNKILFVAHSGPLPPNDGKRQRTYALLKALEERYFIDYVVVDHKADFEAAQRSYLTDSVKFYFIASEQTLLNRIQKKIGFQFIKNTAVSLFLDNLIKASSYDFVFTRYIPPVINIPKGVRIIADIDDDFSEVYSSRINKETSWFKKLRLWEIYWINLIPYRRMLQRLALSIYVKEERRSQNTIILPNLPFQLLNENQNVFKACMDLKILFVGKLSYEPNLKGILWFLKQVWPNLINAIPNVYLTIISSTEVADLEFVDLIKNYPQVELKINVTDLVEVYQQHAIVIAPVFQGGGSSIKIAEALLMGRPVITTTFGGRGYEELITNQFVYCADQSADFAVQIKLLFQDVNKLIETQYCIYKWAQLNYSLLSWGDHFVNDIKGNLTGSLK